MICQLHSFLCKLLILSFREAQVEQKKREVRDSENRRKVNLNTVDWVDNPDRYLLELAGGRPTYAQYDKKTNEKKTNT